VDPSDFLTANFLTANEEPDVEPSVSSSPCPVPPPADGMRPASPSPSRGGLRGGCCMGAARIGARAATCLSATSTPACTRAVVATGLHAAGPDLG
jgi:hypothetical protein